jgi:hypothetical protein
LDQLIEAEVPVIAAIGLTNRMERRDDGLSVAEAVAQRSSQNKSVPYFQLSSALDLLPLICNKLNASAEIRRFIEAEFEDHGLEKLNLG